MPIGLRWASGAAIRIPSKRAAGTADISTSVRGQPHGTGGRQLQMSVDTDYSNNFFVDFSAVYEYFCKILVANRYLTQGIIFYQKINPIR